MANLISEPIMRLYKYVAGKWAKSAEVNAELDMFVDSYNKTVTDLVSLNTQQSNDKDALQEQINTNKTDSEARDTNLQSQINTNKTNSEARDAGLQTQVTDLNNKKASKLDVYTKTEVTEKLDNLAGAWRTNQTIKGNADDIIRHKSSSDHDSRYYTRTETDNKVFGTENIANEAITHDKLSKTLLENMGDVAINARFENLEQETSAPQYSAEIVTYDDVISAPENAINSMLDLSLRGLTATNVVVNGDFSNGLTGWKQVMGTYTVANKTATATLIRNGQAILESIEPVVKGVTGKKVFMRMQIKGSSNLGYVPALTLGNEGTSSEIINAPTQYDTNWNSIYGIVTIPASLNGVDLSIGVGGVYLRDGEITINIKEVLAIDLDNHPDLVNLTADEVNNIFKSWFNSTKSTICAIRNKSVGKNLFDVSKAKKGYIINSAGEYEYFNDAYFASPKYIRINGKVLSIKAFGISTSSLSTTGGQRIVFYDSNKNFISEVGANINTKAVITPPSNAEYMRFRWRDSSDSTVHSPEEYKIMVWFGIEDLQYVPYTESNQYITAKKDNKIVNLSSLSNGTKDEVRIAERKLIKRVSDKKTVSGIDYNDFNTAWTNGDRIKISVNALFGNAPTDQNYNQIQKSIDIQGWTETTSVDSAENVGKFYTTGTGFDVWFIVAKNTYTSLADVQANFPLQTLTYQLAVPIEIPIEIDGSLQVFENGTIYAEPYIKEEFILGELDTTITLPLPITNIDKIEKIVNGEFSETVGTLSEDGRTISGLTVGKYRVFGAIRGEETTQGLKTLRAPVNLKAQVNSNTASISRLSSATIDLKDKVDILIILNS